MDANIFFSLSCSFGGTFNISTANDSNVTVWSIEFSKPICHSSRSIIVTTGIIGPNLTPLYFRPQSIPHLQ